MKYVINRCFGGFGISEECVKKLGLRDRWSVDRTDERLIKMVEEDSRAVSGPYSKLAVVEIPEEATDWELTEYDGVEDIIAVVDGKIIHI